MRNKNPLVIWQTIRKRDIAFVQTDRGEREIVIFKAFKQNPYVYDVVEIEIWGP